ncbi:helix-turn-helix domain-containing protein (plasmid) [Tistrella bauzanensis]|uniref:helix-turn-helix domain-containing protein n=1 Tax=Tistrella TaxID=171436 RepID=UPI0031F6DE9C
MTMPPNHQPPIATTVTVQRFGPVAPDMPADADVSDAPDISDAPDAVDATDAFDGWRSALTGVFDVSLEPRAAQDFRARIIAHDFGQAVMVDSRAGAQRFRRDGRTIARGGLDHIMIQLYRQGGFSGEAEGRAMTVTPACVNLFDMSRTMQSDAGAFDALTLIVPRMLLMPLLDRPEDLHGLVLGADSAAGRILAGHMESLWAEAARSGQPPGAALIQGTAGLIAGCVRDRIAAAPLPDSEAGAIIRHGLRAGVVSAIHRHIDANLASPELSPQQLMRQFHLSRPTLYRLFEASGGVMNEIRNRRLRRCFADIIDPAHQHRRLADIAYAWGFNDEAGFSRAFRRAFGLSPRDARRAASDGLPAIGDDASEIGPGPRDRALDRWIRHLRAL